MKQKNINSSSNDTHQITLETSQYHAMYRRSIDHPDAFWAEQAAQFISWFKPWHSVLQGSFATYDATWFPGAQLNACFNCIDRHLTTHSEKTAILWEGNHPSETQRFSYIALYKAVNRLANVLLQFGIKKGDRVGIYLPMIPEVVISMLACARIGAIHSVIFAGFSAEALKTRLQDADCRLLITANETIRGEKTIPLKQYCDEALIHCPKITDVIVVKRNANKTAWNPQRDHWYDTLVNSADDHCPAVPMEANDPLFILYTSGSTGKPKGILHGTGGYLVYVATTYHHVFNCQSHDVYWCTADVGWITGHSYVVYAPLAAGTTILLYEGIPSYPSYSRYWELIDKYQVSILYTAPTAIRAIRQQGDTWLNTSNRNSLKLLGTVGEPINPDVWMWYYNKVGNQHCPIVDTWWQTETGGIMLTPIPDATPLVPGSVSWPFFGIDPQIVTDDGQPVIQGQTGKLVIKKPWPGMMQTIYGDKKRFIQTYFHDIPAAYLTGDTAYQDTQGCFWITGRSDDVIKVSGHRIGTGEIENALLSHPEVAEAAVVGVPDEIKGETIYAYVTLKSQQKRSPDLKQELINQVRQQIGAIASPEYIQWTEALPKTRSGKILRRLLRKIACRDLHDLGDISTLADADVLEQIIADNNAIQK